MSTYHKEYYQKNKEKILANQKAWREKKKMEQSSSTENGTQTKALDKNIVVQINRMSQRKNYLFHKIQHTRQNKALRFVLEYVDVVGQLVQFKETSTPSPN